MIRATGVGKGIAAVWLGLMGVAILGLGGCSSDDGGGTTPVTYRPADYLNRELSGWTRGPISSGTTETELMEVVDGEYALYTRHGLKEAAMCIWDGTGSQSNANLYVRVIETNTLEGAYALFTDPELAPSSAEPEADIGDTAFVAPSIGGVADLWFLNAAVQSVVILQVTDSPDVQAALLDMRVLATAIDNQMSQ